MQLDFIKNKVKSLFFILKLSKTINNYDQNTFIHSFKFQFKYKQNEI